jgi:hypothetical protein
MQCPLEYHRGSNARHEIIPLRDPAQKDGGTGREIPERIVYAGAQVLQLIHTSRANASKAVDVLRISPSTLRLAFSSWVRKYSVALRAVAVVSPPVMIRVEQFPSIS